MHVLVIPLECVEEKIDWRIRVSSPRIWNETGDTVNSRLYTSGAITALAKANWVVLPHPEHLLWFRESVDEVDILYKVSAVVVCGIEDDASHHRRPANLAKLDAQLLCQGGRNACSHGVGACDWIGVGVRGLYTIKKGQGIVQFFYFSSYAETHKKIVPQHLFSFFLSFGLFFFLSFFCV